MIPSIGYFLVVPKLGSNWLRFKEELIEEYEAKQNNQANNQIAVNEMDLLNETLNQMLEPFEWRFCYVSETEIFFQNRHATDLFEELYGDVNLRLSVQQFHLLSLIETEAFSEENLREMQKIDCFFSCLDAYLSLLQAVDNFQLVQP